MTYSLPNQLALVADGDETAFRDIMRSYSERLYRFALSIVKNPMDAEEAVSDVFLKVWRLRKQLPEAEKFPFYLYNAVKHTALNYQKRKNRKRETEGMYYIEVRVDSIQTPEDIVISKENIHFIHEAVNALPLRCRQIFMLVKQDGLSYREVADLLDLSPATVNVQMTIAVKKLWQVLDPSRQGYRI